MALDTTASSSVSLSALPSETAQVKKPQWTVHRVRSRGSWTRSRTLAFCLENHPQPRALAAVRHPVWVGVVRIQTGFCGFSFLFCLSQGFFVSLPCNLLCWSGWPQAHKRSTCLGLQGVRIKVMRLISFNLLFKQVSGKAVSGPSENLRLANPWDLCWL